MKVCKIFRFDAAHYLPNYVGKCRRMHGHGWVLEMEVEGIVDNTTGMVLDFAQLKKTVSDLVIERLDHQVLNEVVCSNPTCENTLIWIAQQLKPHDCYAFELSRLRLYETPDSFAELNFASKAQLESSYADEDAKSLFSPKEKLVL